MSKKKTKLELTWIGKENRPKLEPRVLIEVPNKSYHAKHRHTENDIFDNRLIFGDNLLALKALEQEYSGQVKCVFIDPPYNTGSAFKHYEDGLEHSIWLSLMRERLELLSKLLASDGSIWMTIDDSEGHYLKVMCDEIFGRTNFIGTATWEKTTSIHNNATLFSSATDMVLAFAKDIEQFQMGRIPRSDRNLSDYSNPDDDPRGPWASSPLHVSLTSGQRGKQYAATGKSTGLYPIISPHGDEIWPPKGRCWGYSPESIQAFEKEKLIWWGKDGRNQPRLKRFLKDNKQGVVPSTLWLSSEVGHNQEAKAENAALLPDIDELFSTPKPERLLKRVIELATNEGDIVLDSFAGSGTTGAVAHKMRRRWIMVELGDHVHTHILPRMKKVIDGTDVFGISTGRTLLWENKLTLTNIKNGEDLYNEMQDVQKKQSEKMFTGYERKVEDGHLRLYGLSETADVAKGGGFQFYKLGPSLIVEDQWGNPVINPVFNAALLSEAMCKLEGFTFDPNPDVYWQQGRSSESDFIYVTTLFMSKDMLTHISEEVGPGRSLLICCGAFRCDPRQFENLTVKKIPKAVLKKCEWGHDDYSLEIENLPDAPTNTENTDNEVVPKKPVRQFGKGKDAGPMLFDTAVADENGGK